MDGTAKDQAAAASARLPERQREALELHEREGLSYDEIAVRLETSWSSVAQLVAHARINFYDELRGTILASMAPSSDCERAPCLIAARQDGELDPDSAEAAWLDAHLAECQRCERGVEEMRAASAAYRDAVPASVAPGDPPAPGGRRRVALALAAAALLLFAGVATAFVRNDSPSGPGEPAAEAADRSKSSTPGAATKGEDGKKARAREGRSKVAGKEGASSDATGAAAPPASSAAPTSEVPIAVPGADQPTGGGGGSASRPSGDAAIDPPRRTTASKPKPAPTATSSPTPSAAPAPAPAPVSEPTTEPSPPEPDQETSRRREPPGKPAHAGPK